MPKRIQLVQQLLVREKTSFCFVYYFFSLDLDINIISPSEQDKIGSGTLVTPNGRTIDDDIDDGGETKN